MKLKTLLVLFLLFTAACGSLPQIVVTPAAPASPTSTPIPISTLSFVPSPTAAIPSTPSNVLVDVSADNVMLRSNPGKLFSAISMLKNKETLTAVGRTPGNNWLMVQTPDNQTGWVSAMFVTIAPMEMDLLAVIQPTGVQVVHGKVVDANQSPVSGVGFALTQGQTRDDATTNTSGDFYFFLPQSTQGAWIVDYVSLDCASNIRVGGCQCPTASCGQPNPPSITISLPFQSQEPMTLIWK